LGPHWPVFCSTNWSKYRVLYSLLRWPTPCLWSRSFGALQMASALVSFRVFLRSWSLLGFIWRISALRKPPKF